MAKRKMGPWSRSRRCSALVFVLFSVAVSAEGADPAWWAQRGVKSTGGVSDYSLLNQGQLKHLGLAAFQELQYRLPGGAGDALTAIILGWSPPAPGTDDYLTLNRGQLKNFAKPFYDRLLAVGYTDTPLGLGQTYPWTLTTADDNDYAYANIGQAKYLFSFDLSVDEDGDGFPDWWEKKYFNNSATAATLYADPDGDGLTNLEEFLLGTDPTVGNAGDTPLTRVDADGDGLSDAEETDKETDPLLVDSDGDGFWDGVDHDPSDANVQLPPADPNDHTAPTVTLLRP